MHAEDLVIDHDGEREVVEHIGEIVPDGCVAVLPATLCVEAVGLGNAAGFMVPSN